MTVTGCEDCPLKAGYWSEDELQHLCAHPNAPEKGDTFVDAYLEGSARYRAGEKAPDWCPLRTAPLTIALAPRMVLRSEPDGPALAEVALPEDLLARGLK